MDSLKVIAEAMFQVTVIKQLVNEPVWETLWSYHKDKAQREVLVYALLEDANDTTFIYSQTLRDVGLRGPEIKLNLHTIMGKQETNVEKINDLVVKRGDAKLIMNFSNPVKCKGFKISTLSLNPKHNIYAVHPNLPLFLGSSSVGHMWPSTGFQGIRWLHAHGTLWHART